jgi:signal peptidase II
MKKLSIKKYAFFSAVILLGIFLDQLTKYLTVKNMELHEEIPVIKNFFSFYHLRNEGAAWGMFDDKRWVFMSISTVAIIGMLIFLFAGFAQNRLYEISLAVIISGGIGNMIDRIALGYVVDMLRATFIDFPVFNVADSFVCIGAALLMLALILDIIKEAKAKKEAENASDGK